MAVFAGHHEPVVASVRPVQRLNDFYLGVDGHGTRNLDRLKPSTIQPLNRPNAHRTIFANTSELITRHITELHQPDLVTVGL